MEGMGISLQIQVFLAMDKNIFEAMGHKPESEPSRSSGNQGRRGPPIGPNKPKVPPLEHEKEQYEMIDRIKGMKSNLQRQIDDVYAKGKEVNLSQELLVDDPSKLSPELQEELRRREQELREKVKLMNIPIKGDLGAATGAAGGSGKEKKGKFRSARNKWIPMK